VFTTTYQNSIKGNTMTHDQRHGGAYDRGGADYFYGRERDPHYFTGGTSSPNCETRITDLTASEIKAYNDGFDDGERDGAQKDWG